MSSTVTATLAQPRSSGAWFEGDPVGDRKFAHLGEIELESGYRLPVTLAYETWGELNAHGSNAVLVLHALTGDSHVLGPTGAGHPTPGWWPHLVGPGKAIDTRRYFVVAANVLGGCQGSTGPASIAPNGSFYGSRFPKITTRDQVTAEYALMRYLNIDTWSLVIGGSMGGMRAIEWAVTYPDLVQRLVVIASAARARGDVIAWNAAQVAAIETSPSYMRGDYYDLPAELGPAEALGVARRIAHTTYRSAEELELRFSNQPNPGEDPFAHASDRFAVASYLDHHASKLSSRFDAGSYVALAKAMNTHDVGRGRGGVAEALKRVTATTFVVAVDSDRLFPPQDVFELCAHIPHARAHLMHSLSGHDGFLVDDPELDSLLLDFLSGD